MHGVPQCRPLGSFLLSWRSWRIVNVSPTAGRSSGDKDRITADNSWLVFSSHCLSDWLSSVLSVISIPHPESSKTSPWLSPAWTRTELSSKDISYETPALLGVGTSGLEFSFSRFICVLYNFHFDIFSLLALVSVVVLLSAITVTVCLHQRSEPTDEFPNFLLRLRS